MLLTEDGGYLHLFLFVLLCILLMQMTATNTLRLYVCCYACIFVHVCNFVCNVRNTELVNVWWFYSGRCMCTLWGTVVGWVWLSLRVRGQLGGWPTHLQRIYCTSGFCVVVVICSILQHLQTLAVCLFVDLFVASPSIHLLYCNNNSSHSITHTDLWLWLCLI